jgi:PAS domain S-box-containing protein
MGLFERLRSYQDWRLRTRFIVFILPVILVLTVLAAWAVYVRDTMEMKSKVSQRARSISTQIMADRKYYTSVVVPRAVGLGGSVGQDYQHISGQFPLPATFVREVSEWTANENEGYTASLISPWPINKAQGARDQFQKDAFAHLLANPESQFSRTDMVSGREVLRFISADRATVQSCADCHNADPRSPKHDYRLGDVMGGLEIVIPIDRYVKEVRQDLFVTVVGLAGLSGMILLGMAFGARQTFLRPLTKLTSRLDQFLGTQEDARSPWTAGARNELTRLDQNCRRLQELIAKQQTQLQLAGVQQDARVQERTAGLLEAIEDAGLAAEPAQDAMVYLDGEGTIRWVNRKGSELLGRPAAQLAGQSFLSFLTPQSADRARARLEALRREQPVEPRVEFDVIQARGGTVRVAVQAGSVREGGKVAGRLLVIRQVNEQKRE